MFAKFSSGYPLIKKTTTVSQQLITVSCCFISNQHETTTLLCSLQVISRKTPKPYFTEKSSQRCVFASRQLAPWHRVFCEHHARLSGCSGRFVRHEWKWSDTPHKSSIVLLFNACGVPHWGQGQLSEEEQYGSDPPLLTGNLLQRRAHTVGHIVLMMQHRMIYNLCMSMWVPIATSADS